MSDTVINLLLQIPLAGVVVFVVVVFLNHLDKSNVRQDAATQRMLDFLSVQEQLNRDFLKEQREESAQSLSNFGERLEKVSAEVARMNGVLSAHDARSQERGRKSERE